MGFTFKDFRKEPNLKNFYRYFGESKDGATLIACSIAIFKGIFRPIFALTDEKSDSQSRKYTAFREGITELAALPLYAITPTIAGGIAEKLAKDVDALTKNKIKTNAKFLGVCAATIIIPAVCNVIQPPIMNFYKKRQEAKEAITENKNLPTVEDVKKPSFSGTNTLPMRSLSRINYGMRIGN